MRGLRHDDLERQAHVPQLPRSSAPGRSTGSSALALAGGRAARRGSRASTSATPARSRRRCRFRSSARAASRRASAVAAAIDARRLRRRHDRAAADREQRPRPALAVGRDRPPRPCTYSNKCLINQIENPLGCYEESRFDSHEEMVRQILSVYDPPPVRAEQGHSGRTYLHAAPLPEPRGQEPALPLEHLRPLRRLRRLGHADAGSTGSCKFARGGVGAIVSSWCGVDPRGFIVPGYAAIDRDDTIPFWRELGQRVHEHDCKYILQLALRRPPARHPGDRVREGPRARRAKPDPLHGFECERATPAQLREIAARVRRGRPPRPRGRPRRRRDPRRQRVHLHAVPLLGDQRPQGRLRRVAGEPRPLPAGGRARDPRARSGDDFHLQVKISATENADAFLSGWAAGTRSSDSVQVCRWLEEAGADAIHVSRGVHLPPSRQPGRPDALRRGRPALRHDALERRPRLPELPPLPDLARSTGCSSGRWSRPADRGRGRAPPGRARDQARGLDPGARDGRLPDRVGRSAGRSTSGDCDAVTIARPLVANPNLPSLFSGGSRPGAAALHVLEQVPLLACSRTRSAATTRAASRAARRC